ncbi:bifunctional DNA-binding transcriptional regulator/O6-methylguanine-DNA methyltransferase Ada [Rosenbergiella australiborealis]|uniref:Bifunctional DNA-binding transcriptional regulator/O6-methylguanine-DNA methyltransferase Ada n=1 Tax=Rosenbergiella australiborealis TaxID=1544696 RepID=A0ABS5T650_9GAMM|nr:bifunctional DNA-binding transcriptional regulator/O6-methylguanine-DNA methyltransferase Ada [Rosenbergiella australiborealis]MBT0726463.1 bifunctional DNA-binding transcriptional regulator/O6-methylguanine-DNA methyltransferase Ada [Rosenbergiella australiborealis]
MSENRGQTRLYLSDDERWQAIKSRDKTADDHFVYAVTTTGYYGLPSAARILPPRESVCYFTDSNAAQAAGYRASPPELPVTLTYPEKWLSIVEMVCNALDNADSAPSLASLAQQCGISQTYLHRLFKAVTGLTPKSYSAGLRACRLRTQLANPQQSVTEAIYQAGYNANSRVYESASGRLGMTPKRYREGGEGSTIYFALGQCSLGAILVAQSEKGICAISLGDDPEPLINQLQTQFPHAELRGGDNHYEQYIADVIRYIEQPRLTWHLPLDIQGTVFQERVWRALREIPIGTTASYSDIAERLGAPKAVRAVAQACAANRIAVIIPCHRVIRRDGSLSGYRWGIDRKQVLLSREKAHRNTD